MVKYLPHKNQFIGKQTCKCLALFPASGIKNVPLLRAAILLTFSKRFGSRKRAEVNYSSANQSPNR
jgi:hypothetical protein